MHKHIDTLNKFNLARTVDPRLSNLTLQYIPFDELCVDQYQMDTFSLEHLADIMSEFHPALVRASSVVLIDNQYYMWDGQHSATACWLNGMDQVPCMLYKCDDMAFKQVASVEKFDMKQMVAVIEQLISIHNVDTIDGLYSLINKFK
jgi:ParB-like chromosome segregation protein Spo0J